MNMPYEMFLTIQVHLTCRKALEEISTQNGPPKKINKIIVKIIK